MLLKSLLLKKIDKIIKDIPDLYKREIKNTYIGAALREALVVGTDIAMDSSISTMYTNPYTAGLAPIIQVLKKLVSVSV